MGNTVLGIATGAWLLEARGAGIPVLLVDDATAGAEGAG